MSFTVPPHLIKIGESCFAGCHDFMEFRIPENLEFKTIKAKTFAFTKIEKFTIPTSVIDLKDGWCYGTELLTQVDVSPNNPRYKKYEDIFIIGKSSIDSDTYDTIIFCSRNVKTVKIPSFIKHIGGSCFDHCTEPSLIEFPKDTQIQTFEEHAFSYTKIERFTLPHNITKIGPSAFYECKKLRIFEFPRDSKVQTFGDDVFCYSNISSLIIPPLITEIPSHAFFSCKNLRIIEINENSNVQRIDKTAFWCCDTSSDKSPVIFIY